MDKKKICFVMNTMNAGGAERVVSILANGFSEKGYHVTILVTSNNDSFYSLNPEINYTKLSLSYISETSGRINKYINRIKSLIQFLKKEKPDIVITFILNIETIIACKVAGIKVLVSERNNPRFDPPYLVLRMLRKLVYPLANGFVFQTNDVRELFGKGIKQKSIVIPNPLNEHLPKKTNGVERTNTVVSVGRLERQKDHKTLLNAFAIVHRKFPDYELIIYGEGNLRKELEEKIKSLGIEESVRLPGKTEDIYSKIINSKVFVFSSLYEGYPNALIEAMALGIPVVSTRCGYGPSEVIEEGTNGFLVSIGNEKEMAEKIEYIIENDAEAERIGRNATIIRGKLKSDDIVSKWINYINSIIKNGKNNQ